MAEEKRFGISLISKSKFATAFDQELLMDKATGEISIKKVDTGNGSHTHMRSFDAELRAKTAKEYLYEQIKLNEPIMGNVNIYEITDDGMKLPFTMTMANGLNRSLHLINFPSGGTEANMSAAIAGTTQNPIRSVYVYVDYTAFNKGPTTPTISNYSSKDLMLNVSLAADGVSDVKLNVKNCSRIDRNAMRMNASSTKFDIFNIEAMFGAIRTATPNEPLTVSVYGVYVGVVFGKGFEA